eukprot:7886017-Heterocapsa_arctica.AAC.1
MQKDLSSIREAVSNLDTTIQKKITMTVDTGTTEGRQKPKHIVRRSMTEAIVQTWELLSIKRLGKGQKKSRQKLMQTIE